MGLGPYGQWVPSRVVNGKGPRKQRESYIRARPRTGEFLVRSASDLRIASAVGLPERIRLGCQEPCLGIQFSCPVFLVGGAQLRPAVCPLRSDIFTASASASNPDISHAIRERVFWGAIGRRLPIVFGLGRACVRSGVFRGSVFVRDRFFLCFGARLPPAVRVADNLL